MKKWEYCYAHVDPTTDPVGEVNKLGEEGWEVCAFEPENNTHHGVFYLKREALPWANRQPTLAELIRAVEESKRSIANCDMLIRQVAPTPFPMTLSDDEAESARVTEAAKALGEHFDAVVILCSRHEGTRGTRTVCKGAGNWHTQYGVVREWLVDADEDMRVEARKEKA